MSKEKERLEAVLQEAKEMVSALRCCYSEEGCGPECPYFTTCSPVGSGKRNALRAAELLITLVREIEKA